MTGRRPAPIIRRPASITHRPASITHRPLEFLIGPWNFDLGPAHRQYQSRRTALDPGRPGLNVQRPALPQGSTGLTLSGQGSFGGALGLTLSGGGRRADREPRRAVRSSPPLPCRKHGGAGRRHQDFRGRAGQERLVCGNAVSPHAAFCTPFARGKRSSVKTKLANWHITPPFARRLRVERGGRSAMMSPRDSRWRGVVVNTGWADE